MKSADCPGDYTHAWHGSTKSVYSKEHNTMLTKGIICTDCGGIWLKEYKYSKPTERTVTWEFYRLDPSRKPIQKRQAKESLP